MNPSNESHMNGNISRRSFFRLAMGSITLLPTVMSTTCLAPVAAYAEEDVPRADLSDSSTIYIVSPREAGFVVRDVSMEDHSPNLVNGAYVKITSRFNGAVLDGVTDDAGTISFDIAELAEDEGKQAQLPRYAFNATIEVSAPGYREFKTGLIRVEGGTMLGIPTQPTQKGVPYPKCTSFDEWDVLYTTGDAATFVSSTGNDAAHTIDVSLRDCPANASVTAGLYCDGSLIVQTTAKADSDGAADISFSDSFLRSDSSAALPRGEDHAYTLRYATNGTTYEVPIKLEVCEAPMLAQKPLVEKDLELQPLNSDLFKLGFSVPKSWPLIGGGKLRFWEPQFPIWASLDPFGFLRLRITSPEFGYINDYGKPEKSGWQRVPRKAVADQYKDAWKKMGDQTTDTFDSMTRLNKDDKRDTFRQTSFGGKLSITAQLEALALATWDFYPDDEDQRVRGQAKASLRAGANYSLTETFWAGPFPIVIRFSIGLNVVAGGMFGFIGPWNPLKWRWEHVSTGFDLQICFPPTLSVGVGIAGVASISLKGSFTVTFSLHYGPLPAGYEDRDKLHLRLAGSVALNVEVEALFFTYSYKLAGKDWPDWYNSWGDGDSPEELTDDGLVAGLNTPLSLRSLNDGKIITAASLEALAEFRTSGHEGMKPLERPLAGYVLYEADGSTVVARMYLTEDQVKAFSADPGVTLEAAAEDAEPVLEPAAEEAVETVSDDVAETAGEADAAAVAAMLASELDAPADEVDALAEGEEGAEAETLVDQDEGEGLVAQGETEDLAMDGENPAPEFDAGEIEQIAGVTDEDIADEGVADTAEDAVAEEEAAGAADEADASDEAGATDDVGAADETVAEEEAADTTEETDTDEQLTAQDDSADGAYILKPTNDQLISYVSSPTDAEPIGNHNYQTIPDTAPDVLRLGLEQGFRPNIDIRVADNILSSSHLKHFTAGGIDYVARIGAVMVAGKVRTRIICEGVGGYGRRVLDFVTSDIRDDCFDYDFDIATTWLNGTEVVNVVTISGMREQGDGTSFAHAASQTFFNFANCKDWASGAFTSVTVSVGALDVVGGGDYPYRNFSCPRLTQIKGSKDGVEYGHAAVAYLERASVLEDEIMNADPELTRAGAGLVFFDDMLQTVHVDPLDLLRPYMLDKVADPSITEIALSDRANGCQLLELKGTGENHYVLLETDPIWYVLRTRSLPRLTNVMTASLGAYEGKISRLIPMESGSYFLTCVDGMLKRADVVRSGEDQASLVFTDFGGAELNMNDFGVIEGADLLYWPETRENGGYTFDGEGNDDPTMREGEEGELNLIKAARVVGGKLSKSFALCEVGHTMSRIRHFASGDDHMSFISSCTVDLETGKGEQWYTAVPWVRCVNLLSAEPYDTMLAKGDHLPFYVMLRNDGNCYLSGVELTVAEVGGSPIGSMRLDFGEDTLMGSEWNPPNEDGTLQNVEDDWLLAPGTTSRYFASYVTIPDDWEGEKQVEVYVTAVYSANVSAEGGLTGQAEDNSIEYLPPKRERCSLTLPLTGLTADEDRENELARADISVLDERGGGRKRNERNDGGSGSKGRGVLPKTDDPLRTSGRTAALLAAGGAASIAAGMALRAEE